MARRAVEIGAAVALWQALGGSVIFATFTMRHRRDQRLALLWGALSKAWGRTTAGSSWQRDKSTHRVAGWLRAVEVTDGANGWHVHAHALLFVEGKHTAATAGRLGSAMYDRWAAGLVAAGLDAPLPIGTLARLIEGPADADLSRYLTKATASADTLGLEVTWSQSKRARRDFSTRPTWALLDDVLSTGDADALDRWHEWEAASKNRRQLTWSQGLRERLRLRREKTDEDVAGEEAGTQDDDLVLITAEGWSQLVRAPHRIPELLSVTEAGGLAALRGFLDGLDVPYVLAGEAGQRAA
jgi:hypothetical protein